MQKNKNKEHSDCLSVLIDLIPEPVIVTDNTGIIVAANSIVGKYSGYSKEKLIGKNFSELKFVGEEYKQLIAENVNNMLKGSDIPPYEIRINGKNGEVRCLEVKGNRITIEGQELDLAIFHDVTERSKNQKQLQQDLLESEEKFQGITNSVQDAIIVVSEGAKITYWNSSAEKIFGFTAEEAIGKDLHQLVVPNTMCKEAKARIASNVKMFAETGTGCLTVGNVELVGRRKDGSEFPAKILISPIKLGDKWNAVGFVKDLTNRKQSEQKMREAEQRYRALFDQAPLGVLVIDPKTGSFIEFNDIAHLQLDYSREIFKKLTVFDIEGKESAEEVKAHLAEIVKNGGAEFETLHVARNGDMRNVLVTARFVELSGKTLLHCIFHDITENKKVQSALMKSEAQYRQLVELANEGIWALSNDFNTCFVNPRMARMLGYTESEMKGKSLFEFIDKEEVEIAKQYLSQLRPINGIVGKFEYKFPRKDGSRIDTNITSSAITDDQGQIIGTLALVADVTEQRKLANELLASEQRFRAISTSSMDAIILVNEEDKIIYWNPASEKTFGFKETEVTGKKLAELVIPDKGRKTHDALLKELKCNSFSKRHFEFTALKKDRTEFPIDLSVASVKLNDKNCLLVTAKDISERKQMESSISQEREMLENITKNIGAGLVIVDANYHILWTNNYLKNRYGGDISNKTCYSTFNTLSTVCPGCGPKKIFEGAELNSREYLNKEFQDKGVPCWFELIATPVKDKDGKVIAALELTVDITEKKQLEEKIREERNKLEAITENISAGLMLVNKDYKIAWINKFGKQMFGEIVNQTCYSAIHGRNHVCSECGAKKILEGKMLDIHETTVNRNGKTRILEVTATPMKDKNGTIAGVLELGMDITEIKKLQGELSKYSQRLEDLVRQRTEMLKQTQAKLVKSERLAAIGELAGMVGHDLRNPLSGIKNATYFLKKKGKAIPEYQAVEMLETIDKCVNYSNKIVSDLLDYSREIHLDVQDYSPRNLIMESLAMVNVPEKIEILNHVAHQPLIRVDPDKIKRVFINLIKNGVEAMPKVGKLTIESKETNGELEISFTDTGVGIPDEILPKLFAPLFTTKAQGMGFGLAICKRIIEAHGGTIKVKTANGAGTTFSVSLPIKTENELGGENILIETPKLSLLTMTKA